MSELSPQDEKLRQMFRWLNKFMLLLWRSGLGNWLNMFPTTLGRYMVITHTGRKTGERRRTPVNYTIYNGEVYCTAGFGAKTDWYRNLKANPQVEVWLPDGWWGGLAEDVFEPESRLKIMRQLLIHSGFAGRLAGFSAEMPEEELAQLSKDYCLVRIRQTIARTGPGGPGDLAWIWPLATFILLPMALKKNRKRK